MRTGYLTGTLETRCTLQAEVPLAFESTLSRVLALALGPRDMSLTAGLLVALASCGSLRVVAAAGRGAGARGCSVLPLRAMPCCSSGFSPFCWSSPPPFSLASPPSALTSSCPAASADAWARDMSSDWSRASCTAGEVVVPPPTPACTPASRPCTGSVGPPAAASRGPPSRGSLPASTVTPLTPSSMSRDLLWSRGEPAPDTRCCPRSLSCASALGTAVPARDALAAPWLPPPACDAAALPCSPASWRPLSTGKAGR